MAGRPIRRPGRFAPSPSGRMHAGNMFSALLAWASARSRGDEFFLRLEDLDERCRGRLEAQAICEDLEWLGLDWDADPFVQTVRGSRAYDDAFQRIGGLGLVYPCFCSRADLHAASAPHASDGTPIYAGTCSNLSEEEIRRKTGEIEMRTGHGPAWRVRVPDTVYSFRDRLQGERSQNLLTDCGDFVVKRSDGVYAYQLVAVVDDNLMGVGEVVRGSDLLTSTPRQMYLNSLLGFERPVYAHHPLLLAPDGRRLSKRDGDCDMGYIRSRAESPEAFVGKLAFIAGLTDTLEDMSAREVANVFSWDNVVKEDIKLTPCFEFV